MKEGYIRNCKLSGSISSSKDNVGGFVGHTLEGKIVKVQNCVNNANISTNGSNAGGLIGCALGAVSVTDCTNNGKLTCDNYNAGGLVGYVKASNYNETEIEALKRILYKDLNNYMYFFITTKNRYLQNERKRVICI